MQHKKGLKLWSINTGAYLEEAKRLYEEGLFEYIELYVVPNSTDTIKKWKNTNIPFSLHAPHFMHEVNLADIQKRQYNKKIFEQVKMFLNELSAQYVVVHGGMEGNIQETIFQLLKIVQQDFSKYLIENKPYNAPIGGKFCRGAIVEEIEQVIKEVKCGFCLDIGHAICTANALNLNPYEYIKEYNKLKPQSYHFSDNDIKSTQDRHLHFGAGTIDFEKIVQIIDKNINIAIETKKDSKENLNDFVEDVKFLRDIL